MNSQLVGKRIATRYDLTSLIGRGGMGAVYRAQDAKAGREIALKLIRPEFSSDPKSRRRFNKEARAFAYLKHENIVEVYDFGQDEDGTLYLAMELVDGTSLRVLRRAHLPLSGILSIVDQLLAALAHAHARGVIHRDLKPENVLVSQNPDTLEPIVKLVDFGLASLPAIAAGNTQNTGSVIGTPSYMAPEQARGSRSVVGPSTDIYAIGVMLYELLCDRLPYEADGGIELILKHVQQPIPPLRPRDDFELPPELPKAVHRAMAKKPWDRFVNAADFRRALQKIDVPQETMPRFVRRGRRGEPDEGDKKTPAPEGSSQPTTTTAPEDPGTSPPIEAQADARPTSELGEHETALVRELASETAPAEQATPKKRHQDTPDGYVRTRSGAKFPQIVIDDREAESEQIPTPPVGDTHISSMTFSITTGELVGRDNELERVRNACERALGGQGQVIVLEGEPGIGKTRLARSVVHRYTETGLMRAAVGLYTATEGSGANVGLRGALEGIFGTTDMDRSAMAAQTRGVLERLGVHDEHDKRELVEFLRAGSDVREERDDLAEGAVRRHRSRLALIQRTIRLIAQEMPLLLVLEDIHWATDGITGFLESMASSFRLHATPCSIVCTLAPDEAGPGTVVGDGLTSISRFDAVQRIQLGRLDDEDMTSLIQQTLPLNDELTEHLVARAGGNPFYALHFLQALRQDGRLTRADDGSHWRLCDDVALESALPASVGDVLRGRIQRTRSRLGDHAESFYEILTLCAVLGLASDDQLIEAFVSQADEALDAHLDNALDAWIEGGVLRESADRQADVVEFDHPLMREVILEDVPSRRLRRLHKLAATTKRDHYYPFLQGS